jgi:hypothetical protein
MQTGDVIRRVPAEVVENLPGTVRHVSCTREDAEKYVAEALERILARMAFAAERENEEKPGPRGRT